MYTDRIISYARAARAHYMHGRILPCSRSVIYSVLSKPITHSGYWPPAKSGKRFMACAYMNANVWVMYPSFKYKNAIHQYSKKFYYTFSQKNTSFVRKYTSCLNDNFINKLAPVVVLFCFCSIKSPKMPLSVVPSPSKQK